MTARPVDESNTKGKRTPDQAFGNRRRWSWPNRCCTRGTRCVVKVPRHSVRCRDKAAIEVKQNPPGDEKEKKRIHQSRALRSICAAIMIRISIRMCLMRPMFCLAMGSNDNNLRFKNGLFALALAFTILCAQLS
jgi:hypothetical protein